MGIKHVSASDLTGEREVYLKRQNKEVQIIGEQVGLWKGFRNKRKEQWTIPFAGFWRGILVSGQVLPSWAPPCQQVHGR